MLNYREIYCPAHFGNSYECAYESEMHEILSEAEYWGYNIYSDWFDTIDLYDLYDAQRQKENLFNLPEAMCRRKFSHYKTASKIGLELGLSISPNHVFSEQVHMARHAVKGKDVFGELLCPADEKARDIIFTNYKNLFSEFKRNNLALNYINALPYDYGGCLCEKCTPWITTFLALYNDIYDLAKSFFPEIKANVTCWWLTAEEHKLLDEWLIKNKPAFLSAKVHHIKYGESSYDVSSIPNNARISEKAFVHVGYSSVKDSDIYGHFGPVSAPERIEKTVSFLNENNADGFIAYCEGTFGDLNQAILAGLSTGAFKKKEDVLEAYAEKYFGGNSNKGWSEWLSQWENAFEVDVVKARNDYNLLAKNAKKSWRLEQWECKLKMYEHHHRAMTNQDWDAAKSFWKEKEYLWRKVWGLGLTRHIFRFDWRVPPWQHEYEQDMKIKEQNKFTNENEEA